MPPSRSRASEAAQKLARPHTPPPPPRFLGQYLLDIAAVTAPQLHDALDRMRATNSRIGDLAVSRGDLAEAQADHIQRLQRVVDGRFGEVAISLGLLNARCVQQLLAEQAKNNLRLGDAVIACGFLDRESVQRHLARFETDESARELAANLPRSLRIAGLNNSIHFLPRLARRCARLQIKYAPTVHGMPGDLLRRMPHQSTLRLSGAQVVVMTLAADSRFATALARGLWAAGPDAPVDDKRLNQSLSEFLSLLGRHAKASAQLNGQPSATQMLPAYLHGNGAVSLPMCALDGHAALVMSVSPIAPHVPDRKLS